MCLWEDLKHEARLLVLAHELEHVVEYEGRVSYDKKYKLKDPALKESFRQTVQNFSILSSNLSHYGLLYKPRQPRPAHAREEGGPKGGRGASTFSP